MTSIGLRPATRLDSTLPTCGFRSGHVGPEVSAVLERDPGGVGRVLDDANLGNALVGRLRRFRRNAKTVLSFAFDPDGLRGGHRLVLDPALIAQEGEQYSNELF